jgi:hypothetical protein
MKKIIILCLAMLTTTLIFADTIPIGRGVSYVNFFPISGSHNYSYTQQIYTQTEINKAGNITKLRFYCVSGSITNSKDWVIYMGHTIRTTFSSATDWEPLANLTQVFAGDVSSYFPSINDSWMEIPLTTPFYYNNINNLVIAVDENTYGSAPIKWGAFKISGFYRGIYYHSDSENPDPAFPPTALYTSDYTNRINLVFTNTSAPKAPILLFPVDGGWAFTDGVLSWIPTLGAGDPNAYDVYFGTSTNPPLVISNQTATTYTTPTLAAETTYYWKVVARNELGDSPATAIWSFKTPTATQLAESFEGETFPPEDWANTGTWERNTNYAKHGIASASISNSLGILSTPMVTITDTSTLDLWYTFVDEDGYFEIVYSSERTNWENIVTIGNNGFYIWNHIIVDLRYLAGNNYYLGIRISEQQLTYIDCIFGPEISPPDAPTLNSPEEWLTNVILYPEFSWTAPTTGNPPTGYKLYCDTNDPPTTVIANVTTLSDTVSYTVTTPLAYNTTYYWTVSAYNDGGEGQTANVRSFTTILHYDIPANQPTVVQGTTVTSNINLNLKEVADDDPLVQTLPNYDNLVDPIVFGLTDADGAGTGNITIEVNSVNLYGVIYYGGVWYQGEPYPCGVGKKISFYNVYYHYGDGDVVVVLSEGTDPNLGEPYLYLPDADALDVSIYPEFSWNEPTTGDPPTGYKLYCDTNNPPTTVIADVTTLSYTVTTHLAYNKLYYWTVSAYNTGGEGQKATVRSFTTRNYDIPANLATGVQGTTVTSTINLDLKDVADDDAIVQTLPNYDNLVNPIVFGLTDADGIGTGNITIVVNSANWYGVIYYNSDWHKGSPYPCGEDTTITSSGVYYGAKGDVVVVLNEGTAPTLPVELSAFTANINSQGGITIMWVTQSETGVNGFYVNRAMVNDLAIAERISPLIPGSNTSQQQVYVFSDNEVYKPGTYYYWLEIQDIDGVVNYYGSRSVTFGGNGNNGTPDIPLVTGIRSIYPNPFNPSAKIMYELNQPANVRIDVINNRGQIVRSFELGQKEKGRFKLEWDGTDNSGNTCGTGIYFIKMQAGKEMFIIKAALVK